MKTTSNTATVLLPTVLSLLLSVSIAGCSSTPQPQVKQEDKYNSSDAQRFNAKQAQDELNKESSKKNTPE
jgi:outer membrane murein-binding lipoprotein Lpp